MDIQRIVIEREDGPLYCGLLFYEHGPEDMYLPWTVDLQNPQRVVLKLFPPEQGQDFEVVQHHYQVMADAIVECVMSQPH